MDEFSQKLYDAGMNDGMAKGEAKGKAEGETKEKFATVKRMLKRGKSSLVEIAEDTELPLATVQQIQAEMQTAYFRIVFHTRRA